MPKEKAKLKPHQIALLISDYKELLNNKDYLKAIIEFVAKYRFLTLAETEDSVSKQLYKSLYGTYIQPLVAQIQSKYAEKDAQAKCFCIDTIVELLTKDPAHNDAWSALFVANVCRKPADFLQWPRRSLSQELPSQRTKMALDGNPLISGGNDYHTISLGKVHTMSLNHMERDKKRKHYLESHLPQEFNYSNHLTAQIVKGSALTGAFLAYTIAARQDEAYRVAAGIAAGVILIPALVLVNLQLEILINKKLPSHLEFSELPPQVKEGLLSEISSHIADQIDSYTRLLPQKPKSDSKDRDPAPAADAKTGLFAHTAPSTQDSIAVTKEVLETKKQKIKRRDHYPTPNYSLVDDTPIQRWKTKKYGEITFRPGRASEVIGLWAGTKYGDKSQFDGRYAVLYPRKSLEQKGDKRQIASFWQTATFGRIVHSQDEAGYVRVTDSEKRDPKCALLPHTVFKIKSFHAEQAQYRQPVVPCEVEGTDENGMELLVAQQPVKTH